MPKQLDIMRAIASGLDQINPQLPPRNPPWNRAVLTKLCEVGHRFNYRVGVRGGRYGADWGEWLYDVTWLKYNEDHHHDHLIDVPLVAECEWSGNFNNVKDDFHKLLLARAGVRLMIYSYYALGGLIYGQEPGQRARREQAARDIAERLAESVRRFKYRHENEGWLLAGGVWHVDSWCRYFAIDPNGAVVPFKP